MRAHAASQWHSRPIHLSSSIYHRERVDLAANATGSRIQAPMGHLRIGAVPTYYWVSVDTRMTPGDDDVGRNDTLRRSMRRGERPREESETFSYYMYIQIHVRTGVPPSVVWASISHHRLPAPSGYPQTPHGSIMGLYMYGQAAHEGFYPLPAYRRPAHVLLRRGVYGPLGEGGLGSMPHRSRGV